MSDLLTLVINAAIRAEREEYLGAGRYERSPDRCGHANGFKPTTVQTRLGDLTFAVPHVRNGGLYPQALEKSLRSERALRLALAEMYVQGVSTRKVSAIIEQLCGSEGAPAHFGPIAATILRLSGWPSQANWAAMRRVP